MDLLVFHEFGSSLVQEFELFQEFEVFEKCCEFLKAWQVWRSAVASQGLAVDQSLDGEKNCVV